MTERQDNGFDREQTLEWLRTVPGYREVIRQRISEEQIRRYILERRLLLRHELNGTDIFGTRSVRWRPDTDKLGREVEGCG